MKITRRQLKRLIKEELGGHLPLNEAHPVHVEQAIETYTSPEGSLAWRMAANEFRYMADGEFLPGISDEYYANWKKEDFQAVLDAVESYY